MREQNKVKIGSLWNTLTDLNRGTYGILKNIANVPVRKKGLSLLNKASREATRNKLVTESQMPHREETSDGTSTRNQESKISEFLLVLKSENFN